MESAFVVGVSRATRNKVSATKVLAKSKHFTSRGQLRTPSQEITGFRLFLHSRASDPKLINALGEQLPDSAPPSSICRLLPLASLKASPNKSTSAMSHEAPSVGR